MGCYPRRDPGPPTQSRDFFNKKGSNVNINLRLFPGAASTPSSMLPDPCMTRRLPVANPNNIRPGVVGQKLSKAFLAGRDTLIIKLEKYFLENLDASDVCEDNYGVYMFNLYNMAYLLEESTTEDAKRATRRRVSKALTNFKHETKKMHQSQKGM